MDSISLDSLISIFTYLNVGEISRKCLTNHIFDKVCRSEFLWKNTISRDYSIVEKGNETWRSKAKEVYIESISFWNDIDNDIDYYMVKSVGTEDLTDKFEKMLIDHALKEREEFFVIELIFIECSYEYMYYMVTRRFSKNFVRLFEKVASLSSQKKISIKWILDLINECECECEDERCIQGVCECDEYCVSWRIEFLAHIYLKYDHLFINDVDSNEWERELIIQSV
uniref:F-box-like family protein n=1 Tax=Pithovirus LCPAC406 TaxID=2506599 RepID=A0A481ZEN6_9VIRU|nr:MAG: F-box-like family protein [Pithovirus LCPAC406]